MGPRCAGRLPSSRDGRLTDRRRDPVELGRGILSNPEAPRIACFDERVFVSAIPPWCCARKNSTAVRSPPATFSSAKTVSGGSPTTMPARSSAASQESRRPPRLKRGLKPRSLNTRSLSRIATTRECVSHFGNPRSGFMADDAVDPRREKTPLEERQRRNLRRPRRHSRSQPSRRAPR